MNSKVTANDRNVRVRYLVFIVATAGILTLAAWLYSARSSPPPLNQVATYVGRESCIQCHQDQADLFHGSHHDMAMDVASESTVLASFDDQSITHHGITSRFFRRDGKYFVNTEGPDGAISDFEVKYVFGVDPLQQYMVEFDRTADMKENEVARLQVLRLSWDCIEGKWFYLDPPDVNEKLATDDPLHWTGITQCWNASCAECHSTNLKKNFDSLTRTYNTTFSEIDVSCEACHGPGSNHVAMESQRSLWSRKRTETGLVKLKTPDNITQIESCAPCHSRRRIIGEDFVAGCNFNDYFVHELLFDHTYHKDGQIKDEVYVYGSFVQSKMYHQGIRCSDCHDPHSTKVKYSTNQLCTSCHEQQHPASKYDTPSHHHHPVGSKGAMCVECHMPATTYMAIDDRRDHSFRVPRPDLSIELGTPNACTGCHLNPENIADDKRAKLGKYQDWLLEAPNDSEVRDELMRANRWSQDAIVQWYGTPKDNGQAVAPPDFELVARALAAARDPEAKSTPDLLVQLATDREQSAIARATAARELWRFDEDVSLETARKLLDDKEPMVVMAALLRLEAELQRQIMRQRPDDERSKITRVLNQMIEPLVDKLSHESKIVRMEATRIICSIPNELRNRLPANDKELLDDRVEEFVQAQLISGDRANAHGAIGSLYEQLGLLDRAISSFRTAVNVEENRMGARSRLAPLLEQKSKQAMELARQAVGRRDRDEAMRKQKLAQQLQQEAISLRQEEHQLLVRDFEQTQGRMPNGPIEFQLAKSWYLNGNMSEAEQRLLGAVQQMPRNVDVMLFVVLFYQKLERWNDAQKFVVKLIELEPENTGFQQLANEIEKKSKKE